MEWNAQTYLLRSRVYSFPRIELALCQLTEYASGVIDWGFLIGKFDVYVICPWKLKLL